jgi:hypothetical protein
VCVGVAQLDESAGFQSPSALLKAKTVRFPPLTPDSKYRGLGKRINPLGLGPRESRFKSEVPDQFLWGSQEVRQLAVNQLIAGSNPAPTARNVGVAFCPILKKRGPSPTKKSSRVRSSTPAPDDCAPVAEPIQASLLFLNGAQRNEHPVRRGDTR